MSNVLALAAAGPATHTARGALTLAHGGPLGLQSRTAAAWSLQGSTSSKMPVPMLLTIQVPDYPSPLGEQLRNAFKAADVDVTEEPFGALPVLCLCKDFNHVTTNQFKDVFSHLKNDGGRIQLSHNFLLPFSSRNFVAPSVSDAQSGNEETDAMLSVDAVLFYDNAKEFSLYKYELEQSGCSHFVKPMWNIWPRQPWLQSAAAKIEVTKMLKRKGKT